MANITRRGGQSGSERMPMRREWSPFRMMEEMLGWDPFRQMTPYAPSREAGEMMFTPSFEVKETKDGYLFKADLPGVKESDLDITLSGNMLTISGRREAEEREEGETWYAYERSFGSFSRSFTLPETADADHARADMKDGVLAIMIPKRPEAQPKKISLKPQGGGTTGGGTPSIQKEKPKA